MAEDFHTLFYIGILVPTGVTILVFIAFLICWFKCGLRYKTPNRRPQPAAPEPVFKFGDTEAPPTPSRDPPRSVRKQKGDTPEVKRNVYITDKYRTEGGPPFSEQEGSEHSHDSAIDITELDLGMGSLAHENYADTARLHTSASGRASGRGLGLSRKTSGRRSPRDSMRGAHQQSRQGSFNAHDESPRDARGTLPAVPEGGRQRWESEASEPSCYAESQYSGDSRTGLLVQRGSYPQPEFLLNDCHPKSMNKIYETTTDIARIMDECGIKHNHSSPRRVNVTVDAHQHKRRQSTQAPPTGQARGSTPLSMTSRSETPQTRSPVAQLSGQGLYSLAGYHTNAAFYNDYGSPSLSLPPQVMDVGALPVPAAFASTPSFQEGSSMLYGEITPASSTSPHAQRNNISNSRNNISRPSTYHNAHYNHAVEWPPVDRNQLSPNSSVEPGMSTSRV